MKPGEDTQVMEVELSESTIKNIVDAANAGTAKLAETVTLWQNEATKRWELNPAKTAVAVADEKAPLNESLVGTFKSATKEIVPVAVGGFAAIVVSEVVDGVMIKQKPMVRGAVKAIGAVAVWKWGKKIPFMGHTGKNVMAALLAFDALRDITPISTYASQIANKISGAIPVGGLGDQRGRDTRVEREASQILSSSQRLAAR